MSEAPQVNPLRVAPAEIDSLLAEFERADAAAPVNPRRRVKRWRLRIPKVILTFAGQNGSHVHHIAVPRNLSVDGCGVLFGAFTHVGIRCQVTMRDLKGKARTLPGKVARCSHVKGRLHELGIRFDSTVSPGDFVEFGDGHAFCLENIDLNKLAGTVLMVEDNRADQRLYAHYLKGSKLEVIFAEAAQAGLDMLADEPDIVFVDLHLPDFDGLELIRRANEAGCSRPMVLLTSDNTPGLRARALEVGASELIIKPCNAELLQQAAAEYILIDDPNQRAGGGPIFSSAKPNQVSGELILDYVMQLQRMADELTAALKDAGDMAAARNTMLTIKGSAQGYGFAPLEALAREAVKSLDATMSLEESVKEVRALINGCRRARAPRSAIA